MPLKTVAIIGAGLAGLACARALAARGVAVRLFDKGCGPGGRLATHHPEAGGQRLQFDHGAQYLRAAGSGFAAALDKGGAAPWPDPARRVGVPGMSALPSALLGTLPLAASRHVIGIVGRPGAWRLRHLAASQATLSPTPPEEAAEDGPFDAVLVTTPAPEAVPLVLAVAPALASRLGSVRYAPCWTVMAAFATRLPLPDTLRPDSGAIGWAARDSSKPGRDPNVECWVVQASPAWSHAHIETPPEHVALALLRALGSLAGAVLPPPFHLAAHRWSHALVESALGEECLWDAALGLGFAGDGCIAGRAEAAWDSGAALAVAVMG